MSKQFSIPGSYDTPEVIFDAESCKLTITGRSLPANAFEFYSPVLDHFGAFVDDAESPITIDFKMDFISSSTSKIFQDMFFDLEEAFKNGKKVQVNWYYKFGDDDIKELGDDLRLETTFPFEYIAYS